MAAETTPATCTRCGRILTDPASIARGRGPVCQRRNRAARTTAPVADFTPAQIASAHQAHDDAAVLALRGQVVMVVSTDGTEIHRAHPTNCNCAAGLKARRCWHMAAARIALAA